MRRGALSVRLLCCSCSFGGDGPLLGCEGVCICLLVVFKNNNNNLIALIVSGESLEMMQVWHWEQCGGGELVMAWGPPTAPEALGGCAGRGLSETSKPVWT